MEKLHTIQQQRITNFVELYNYYKSYSKPGENIEFEIRIGKINKKTNAFISHISQYYFEKLLHNYKSEYPKFTNKTDTVGIKDSYRIITQKDGTQKREKKDRRKTLDMQLNSIFDIRLCLSTEIEDKTLIPNSEPLDYIRSRDIYEFETPSHIIVLKKVTDSKNNVTYEVEYEINNSYYKTFNIEDLFNIRSTIISKF